MEIHLSDQGSNGVGLLTPLSVEATRLKHVGYVNTDHWVPTTRMVGGSNYNSAHVVRVSGSADNVGSIP